MRVPEVDDTKGYSTQRGADTPSTPGREKSSNVTDCVVLSLKFTSSLRCSPELGCFPGESSGSCIKSLKS